MNKQALRAVMASKGEVYNDLAKVLDITTSTLSDKINERSHAGFTQNEIFKIKQHYHLSAEQIDLIFFDSEVS